MKAAKCTGIKICTKCSAVWPKSKKSCCKQEPLILKGDECKSKLENKSILFDVPVHLEPPSSAVNFYWFTHNGKHYFASVSQDLTGAHCHEKPNASKLTSREKETLSQMVMSNPSLTASQASYGNCPCITPLERTFKIITRKISFFARIRGHVWASKPSSNGRSHEGRYQKGSNHQHAHHHLPLCVRL